MTQWLEKYEQLEKENAALRSKLAAAEEKLSDYELESGFSLDKSVKAAIHDLELSGMEMPVATIKRLLKRAEAAEQQLEDASDDLAFLDKVRLENETLRKKMEGMEGALRAFVDAYDNEMWPIENEVGLFEAARAALQGGE